jgi:hypothetical protein
MKWAYRAIEPGPIPRLSGHRDVIKIDRCRPCGFIPVSMESPMMGPTEGHGIFVARPAAEGASLDEPQMMGIGRPPSARQARLRRHETQVGRSR